MRLHPYRPLALALLVLHLSACTTWQLTNVSPSQMIVDEQPSRLRITLMDGERVTLNHVEARADSVVGEETITADVGFDCQLRSVAFSDIRQMEIGRNHALRTAALLGPLFLVTSLFLYCATGACEPGL